MAEIDFKRKAYGRMLDWKRSQASHSALLVEGARRVGKTHLIRRFAKAEYESCLFIDFSERGRQIQAVKKAFEESDDVPSLLERLQILFGVRLTPERSCVVFDEVQLFPIAREAIKRLVAYGHYHYIESGSLLGIRESVKNILIPSEEHVLKLHPLDYEEFLWATDNELLTTEIRRCFIGGRALDKSLHEKATNLARQYLVVGGMPQSVVAFLEGGDRRLERAEERKRDILSLYERDIGKYARGYAPKVRAIFRQIPGALNSHEKKFHLSDIDRNGRMRRYENAFLWLADAMVANIAYNATDPSVGLEMNLESCSFKCYSLDTGLLVTQALSGSHDIDGRLLRGILYDRLGVNEGMFFENYVAQTLVSLGHDLFFHSKAVPKMEIDFLVRDGIKICPIEVKSAACHRHASLDALIARCPGRLGAKYVVCTEPLSHENGLTYLPFYALHCLDHAKTMSAEH